MNIADIIDEVDSLYKDPEFNKTHVPHITSSTSTNEIIDYIISINTQDLNLVYNIIYKWILLKDPKIDVFKDGTSIVDSGTKVDLKTFISIIIKKYISFSIRTIPSETDAIFHVKKGINEVLKIFEKEYDKNDEHKPKSIACFIAVFQLVQETTEDEFLSEDRDKVVTTMVAINRPNGNEQFKTNADFLMYFIEIQEYFSQNIKNKSNPVSEIIELCKIKREEFESTYLKNAVLAVAGTYLKTHTSASTSSLASFGYTESVLEIIEEVAENKKDDLTKFIEDLLIKENLSKIEEGFILFVGKKHGISPAINITNLMSHVISEEEVIDLLTKIEKSNSDTVSIITARFLKELMQEELNEKTFLKLVYSIHAVLKLNSNVDNILLIVNCFLIENKEQLIQKSELEFTKDVVERIVDGNIKNAVSQTVRYFTKNDWFSSEEVNAKTFIENAVTFATLLTSTFEEKEYYG